MQAKEPAQKDEGEAFFITEDIRDEGLFPITDGVEQIQEEKSYGSETANNERQISKQRILDESQQESQAQIEE